MGRARGTDDDNAYEVHEAWRAVHAARRALDQGALLRALEENAKRRDPHTDWKRIHAYAEELSYSVVDPRKWADAHISADGLERLEPAARLALGCSLTTWHDAHLLDDHLFMEHRPDLGPLADLRLYSTDFSVWDALEPGGAYYEGMAHAPGLCQHSDRITAGGVYYDRGDEVLRYGEFLARLAASKQTTHRRPCVSRPCSKCGGVAMPLLTAAQLDHLARVRDEIAVKAAAAGAANVTPIRPEDR